MELRRAAIGTLLLFILGGAARAQDSGCHEAVVRSIAMRHANLALNLRFKHDYAAAHKPATEADINKLNADVVQMAAMEETEKRYLAQMPPQCIDLVLERLHADQTANPDVESLK